METSDILVCLAGFAFVYSLCELICLYLDI